MVTKSTFKGRTMPTKKVPLSKLDMDLQNPRLLVDGADQEDAMMKMLTTTGDKCMELLRDITEIGELSSSDLPIVVQEGNRFTVLEGNRRLLCLRLWRKPNLITRLGTAGEPYVNRVSSYISKSSFEAPEKIDVVVADSRGAADDWIDKRHGLGGGGASTVEWDSFQRDRRRSQKDPEKTSFSYAFVSFILNDIPKDSDLHQDLWKLVDDQYTVLSRIFRDPSLRSALGISFSRGIVTLENGMNETLPALRQLIKDLALNIHNSRTLDKVGSRSEYAEKLHSLLPREKGSPYVGKTPQSAHVSHEEAASTQSPHSSHKAEPIERKQPPRRKRQTAKITVFSDTNLDQFPVRLQDLVEEISQLDVTKTPEICSAVIRVLLDLSLEYFEDQCGIDRRKYPLWVRTKNAISHLDPPSAGASGQVQKWSLLKELQNRCTEESMKIIQLGVHSSQMGNLTSEVTGWTGRIEPLLTSMNEYLRNNPKI